MLNPGLNKDLNTTGSIATEAKQDEIISYIKDYQVLINDVSATVSYIGKSLPGTSNSTAGWKITKLDTSTGLSNKFADGVSTFTKVWDDRLIYTY